MRSEQLILPSRCRVYAFSPALFKTSQVRETRRQREHEQMLVQIQRTERIVDDCCAPVIMCLYTHTFNCVNFAIQAIYELEKSNPEVLAPLVTFASRLFDVKDDGTLISKTSGLTFWEGTPPASASIIRANGTYLKNCPSSMSVMPCPVIAMSMLTNLCTPSYCMPTPLFPQHHPACPLLR